MRCPKCGHDDYNGRCCQECGYPQHQLRSESAFVPPPEFQKAERARDAKGPRLPGETAKRRASREADFPGPDLSNGKGKKGRGCGCIVLVLILGTVVFPLVMGMLGSWLEELAEPVPEPGYSYEEDWDSGYEGEVSLEEPFPEADPQVLEAAAAQMEQAVLGQYGSASLEMALEYSDFEIMMGMGDSHFVSLALLAREGDLEAVSQWEELTENLCRIGTDAYDLLVELDAGQCDADIYLYDPQDGNLYFYQSNGTVYYDYVEEGAL